MKRDRTHDDILIEAEIDMSNEIKNIPTEVLEAELRRRRQTVIEKITDADLDRVSAEVFGRQPATSDEGTEADMDAMSAEVFGRKVER